MLNKLTKYFLVSYSFLICISIILTNDLSNDDHMYLAAASMLSAGDMYKDFAYVQMPYMPYLYKFVFDIFNNNYIVLQSRILESAIVLLILISVHKLSLSLSKNELYASFSVFILANLYVFQFAISFARNYNTTMLLLLFSLILIEKFGDRTNRRNLYFAMGLTIGITIGFKLTYLTFIPFFIFVLFAEFGVTKSFFKSALIFSFGTAVGLVPAGLVFYTAGLESSLFNNFHFYQFNIQWWNEQEHRVPMSVLDKLKFSKQMMISSSFLLIILVFQTLLICHARKFSSAIMDRTNRRYIVLVLLSMPMFLIPSPAWAGYFSVFVLSLILLSNAITRNMDDSQKISATTIGASVSIVLLFSNILNDGSRIASLTSLENWNGIKIHRIGENIRSSISAASLKRPVATLSPIYALEAGLPIYRELASGPFTYRVGKYLSERELKLYSGTSPSDIFRLLDETPPSAILVGFEMKQLEKPLVDYARSRGYTNVTNPGGGGILYTKNER